MTKEEERYLEIGSAIPDAIKSQLFGKQCFKINGKPFVCYFNSAMVFKLSGEIHSEALSLDGSRLFDPSGKKRPMREWVEVPFEYENKWSEFAEAALEYVGSLQK